MGEKYKKVQKKKKIKRKGRIGGIEKDRRGR